MDKEEELKDKIIKRRELLVLYKEELRHKQEALPKVRTTKEEMEIVADIMRLKKLIPVVERELAKLEDELMGIQGIRNERLETIRLLDNLPDDKRKNEQRLQVTKEIEEIAKELGITFTDFLTMLREMNHLTFPEYNKFLKTDGLNDGTFYEQYKSPEPRLKLQKRIDKFKRESDEGPGLKSEIKMR